MSKKKTSHARRLDLQKPLLVFALAACAVAQSAETVKGAGESPAVAKVIESPERFTGDREEDSWRHPSVVLQFLDIKPGMHELDYFAGSGYYSELLARTVGLNGSVIVYNNKPYADFSGESLTKRFASNRLPNAKVVTTATGELKLDANSLDGVLFFWSYHDLYWQPKEEKEPFGDTAKVTAILFKAVKPGGIVVVVDHVANPGGDVGKVVDAMHRIDPQIVRRDFTRAGFVFDGESTTLRNTGDDHTKPVFDPAVRHKTDQFMYKFRKPAK